MAVVKKKTRVVGNPGARAFGSRRTRAKSRSKARHKARRRNIGGIVGYTLGNPGVKKTKGSKMAKTKQKYASKSKGSGRRHHRRNPGTRRMMHKRRRNPGALGGGLGPMVTNAVGVIIGALGSKLAAQAVLGANNTGPVGYVGNAAAGGVLWFLSEKMLKNRNLASGIIAGTVVQIILRVINDYTPFGSYLNQLGMGDYQMQSFVTPQVLVDPLNSAEIQIPPGWAPVALPAPAAASAGSGVSGLYGARRFGKLY